MPRSQGHLLLAAVKFLGSQNSWFLIPDRITLGKRAFRIASPEWGLRILPICPFRREGCLILPDAKCYFHLTVVTSQAVCLDSSFEM